MTGTSNGGLTAHPGGDRWRWESRIFGAAYDTAPAHERPVYGALNFRRQLVGASPRFGSSHFRMSGKALGRVTFCYPDSAAEPSAFGVAAGMCLIELAEADDRDALDDYIEAQVHGQVVLARDMEALVLDASYRDTPVEAAARRLPCPQATEGAAVDTWERARQVLDTAGLPPEGLVDRRTLPGGTYNTVEELRLADGTRYVLKIPPSATVPGLSHERGLLSSEAEFYRAAATVGVPAPEVVTAGERRLLMTYCPGTPWGDLETGEHAVLRKELGQLVARLHSVTGRGFGYPSGALGPLAPDWRTAFTTMYDAVLGDARHYDAWLPCPVDEVARTAKTAYDALDEVTVPRLVHFDLWQGNILVERPDGTAPRIGGLIDGERMFWGDPLADFVSLALLADIKQDEDFLSGYQEAGGRAEFDSPARQRLALYRSYLYLIMLVETVPRAPGAEQGAWVREAVAPELLAALDELG